MTRTVEGHGRRCEGLGCPTKDVATFQILLPQLSSVVYACDHCKREHVKARKTDMRFSDTVITPLSDATETFHRVPGSLTRYGIDDLHASVVEAFTAHDEGEIDENMAITAMRHACYAFLGIEDGE